MIGRENPAEVCKPGTVWYVTTMPRPGNGEESTCVLNDRNTLLLFVASIPTTWIVRIEVPMMHERRIGR